VERGEELEKRWESANLRVKLRREEGVPAQFDQGRKGHKSRKSRKSGVCDDVAFQRVPAEFGDAPMRTVFEVEAACWRLVGL
jgi:hypothetical protein